ncbi:anti-sigma factor domain-containing protein, partial [Desulfosporosinus sp. BICA1-9]
MKKTRGIVMKTSKKATILYTESGDYLEIKTPKTTPALGQVIEIELPVHKPLSHRLLRFGSIAAILLLALTLSVYNIVSVPNTAVAAVVMDMDTSLEL